MKNGLVTRIVVLAAIYFVGGLLGKQALFMPGDVALVWPPFGIALAAIILFGQRYWIAVALGAFFFSFISELPPDIFTLGTVVGNTMGALVCGYLLERLVGFRADLGRIRDVTAFVGLACFLGTTVNAAFNAVSVCYAGRESWDELFSVTLGWWVPNAMAGLVITPVILAWGRPSELRWRPRLVVEAFVCSAGLIIGTLVSFNSFFVYGVQNFPLAYLPYPFLVWGAVRFEARGATMGTLVVSALSIHQLIEGLGPFVAHTKRESLVLIGTYIGVISIGNLLLAAAVTQRRRAEQALRESEEFFRLISDSMTDMVAVIGRERRRLYNSPSYKKVLGDPESLIGSDSFEEIHPDDRSAVKRIFEQTIATGAGQRTEYRFLRKDGSIRYVESQGSVIRDGSGEVSKIVVVSRDITERLNLEEQLRQSTKMEAIGRLAGGIAHDFNNLMQAVLGHASAVKDELPREDPNWESLEAIETAAGRAASLTRQLLAFSRKQVLVLRVLALNNVLEETEKLLRRLIGVNIRVELKTSTEIGLVRADQSQLDQVMLNLALNARDAMPGGGTLTIETENLQLDSPLHGFGPEFKPGPYVRLSVRDTGLGIPPDVQLHLFEPFFTTKGPGRGTGLGLSIVYGIVKQSGGEINYETEPDRGTNFNIYLPRVQEAPAAAAAEPVSSLPVKHDGKATILLAEDEEIVRNLLAEVLTADGHTVLCAEDGRKALELALGFSGPIHLLVTDLMMPHLNGWEMSKELLKSRPQTAIIYISGYSRLAEMRDIKIDESAVFLQKPFHPAILVGKVREMLNRSHIA